MIWQLSNMEMQEFGGDINDKLLKIPVCIINQAIGGINLGWVNQIE
jgi:hypothetical protein